MEDSRLSKTYAITLKEINNKNSKILDQKCMTFDLFYNILSCNLLRPYNLF